MPLKEIIEILNSLQDKALIKLPVDNIEQERDNTDIEEQDNNNIITPMLMERNKPVKRKLILLFKRLKKIRVKCYIIKIYC